jgi:hypothetical protein
MLFICEYAVQISQSLLQLHMNDVIHGDVELGNVLTIDTTLELPGPSQGFTHKFKLTNLKPWSTEIFPFNEGDLRLIQILK